MNHKLKIDLTNPSILTKDMNHCYLCGKSRNIEWHHIMSNASRNKSTEYKLIVPLCRDCHTGTNGVHNNHEKMLYLKKKGQEAFEKEYPDLDFLKIFHRNYL